MGPQSDTINPLKAVRLLNELLNVLCRSLPAYLADAKPWARAGDQRLHDALENLLYDQQRYAGRIGEAIVEFGGHPDPGLFPMSFTAKHDLSIEFLVGEIIAKQEDDLLRIGHCISQFESVSSLHALAEEIFGNMRGHLDILKELVVAR